MTLDRDPAAVHLFGLGFTLEDVFLSRPTFGDFPTAGITGRLGVAEDTGCLYRDYGNVWTEVGCTVVSG